MPWVRYEINCSTIVVSYFNWPLRIGNKKRSGEIAMTAIILLLTSSGQVIMNANLIGTTALGQMPMVSGRTKCLLRDIKKGDLDQESH